jgi:hypothetical protein
VLKGDGLNESKNDGKEVNRRTFLKVATAGIRRG